ncbi:TM0106 family RecB-like putative nuclease [Corynebacterium alimapuense]|uniref:Recombinase RecB n=1 Tax=Corynebacterium alimapuense TaxID=1576874 RepID=A0A3M8KA52_9CORY|nr:recombinase RecB [Corynebacterium alimapuense]
MVGYAHAIVSASDYLRVIGPADLVGCRYRLVQRRRYPSAPRSDSSLMRLERIKLAREVVLDCLPQRPALGDGRSQRFIRIDIARVSLEEDSFAAELATLEALAAEATLITGAVFTGESENTPWRIDVDILVRQPEGTYLPVIISNHRVARAAPGQSTPVLATGRLGLGKIVNGAFRLRHHAGDGHRLAFAARALQDLDLDSGRGGLIGQDRSRAFIVDTDHFQEPLTVALTSALPAGPRRVKGCASCRFWPECESELKALDEISLFLPGDRARSLREAGIETVSELVEGNRGELSALARAWRDGVPLLRRVDQIEVPAAEVEIDIDMEAYLDQGAYLWGAYDGERYRPFVTWESMDSDAEAENFASFWAWLMERREQAHAEGKSFAVYCWSANGENHWMKMSARRFGGQRFGDLQVPRQEEISEFISSSEWIDLFRLVRTQFAGPAGLGLKIVAPVAGYTWADGDFDGEASVNARRLARGVDKQAMEMRALLLRYNEDDCRATAAVRDWLRHGAPGTPRL